MHVRLKPNIFFLVIDSLRQDKCLGKSKTSVTPTLDKLIQNGTFFNQNISTAPITVPSLSSIFTGLYPFECTTIDNNIFNLNQNLPTFSDDLINSGYQTYAIIPEVLKHTNISKLFANGKKLCGYSTKIKKTPAPKDKIWPDRLMSIRKIKTRIGWKPKISIEQGIDEILENRNLIK